MKMKFLIYPLLLAVLCLSCVTGSVTQAAERSLAGYAYVAPGARSGLGPVDFNLSVGGGAEYRLVDGFGVAADIGYVFLNAKKDFGIFSPGIFYQFQPSKKVVPFVEGGYALGFHDNTFNMAYFGGGVNYWASDRLGIKLEVRDHIGTDNPARLNLIEYRIGLLFR